MCRVRERESTNSHFSNSSSKSSCSQSSSISSSVLSSFFLGASSFFGYSTLGSSFLGTTISSTFFSSTFFSAYCRLLMISSISPAAGLLMEDSEGSKMTLFDRLDSSRSTAGFVFTVCVVMLGFACATLSMQDLIKSVNASRWVLCALSSDESVW